MTGIPARYVLRLLHLSDIHFHREIAGDHWDLDQDLRNEVERDVRRLVGERGRCDGVLVTGDIAFSGQTGEYEKSAGWLRQLTELAGCREEDVWLVPGNHDVDRSVVRGSPTIQAFHERLRTCGLDEIDPLIHRYLVGDIAGGDTYLLPLRNFNAFAAKYQCGLTAINPYWEDFRPIGGSGITIRLRGLNTVLVSDHTDDADHNRQVVGSVQGTILRLTRTITITLAHHPPTWIRDGDLLEAALFPRAQIQLWGHLHSHHIAAFGGSVRLSAGAVHPERGRTDWEPRYNLLEIAVTDGDDHADLIVLPRVWETATREFGPDGVGEQRYRIDFEPTVMTEPRDREEPVGEPPHEPLRDARRQLAFAFSSLAYQNRLSVARDLGLLDPDVRDLPDQQLFELILGNALRGNRLGDLWERVRVEQGADPVPNPFGPDTNARTNAGTR
jgi:hypothetical protein